MTLDELDVYAAHFRGKARAKESAYQPGWFVWTIIGILTIPLIFMVFLIYSIDHPSTLESMRDRFGWSSRNKPQIERSFNHAQTQEI